MNRLTHTTINEHDMPQSWYAINFAYVQLIDEYLCYSSYIWNMFVALKYPIHINCSVHFTTWCSVLVHRGYSLGFAYLLAHVGIAHIFQQKSFDNIKCWIKAICLKSLCWRYRNRWSGIAFRLIFIALPFCTCATAGLLIKFQAIWKLHIPNSGIRKFVRLKTTYQIKRYKIPIHIVFHVFQMI